MSAHCEDCGCKVYGGICSNCQEELFIMENQYHEDPYLVSKEFVDKAKEQKKLLESRKEKP